MPRFQWTDDHKWLLLSIAKRVLRDLEVRDVPPMELVSIAWFRCLKMVPKGKLYKTNRDILYKEMRKQVLDIRYGLNEYWRKKGIKLSKQANIRLRHEVRYENVREEHEQNRVLVRKLLRSVKDPHERQALRLTYLKGMTCRSAGKKMGLTGERVRQLRNKAISGLRTEATDSVTIMDE